MMVYEGFLLSTHFGDFLNHARRGSQLRELEFSVGEVVDVR